jgi:hypothetical protein
MGGRCPQKGGGRNSQGEFLKWVEGGKCSQKRKTNEMNIKDAIYPTIKKKFDELTLGPSRDLYRFRDSDNKIKLIYWPSINEIIVDIDYFMLTYLGFKYHDKGHPVIDKIFIELVGNAVGKDFNKKPTFSLKRNKPLKIDYIYMQRTYSSDDGNVRVSRAFPPDFDYDDIPPINLFPPN